MSLLAPLLFVPAGAALGCSLVRSRRVMAALGVLAFGLTLAVGMALLRRVAVGGAVTQWGGFLRADALSAWMVVLISVVSLATSVYAGRYFQRDLAAGVVTHGQMKEFFILTP
jgi:hydrogenase-4 component F